MNQMWVASIPDTNPTGLDAFRASQQHPLAFYHSAIGKRQEIGGDQLTLFFIFQWFHSATLIVNFITKGV